MSNWVCDNSFFIKFMDGHLAHIMYVTCYTRARRVYLDTVAHSPAGLHWHCVPLNTAQQAPNPNYKPGAADSAHPCK